ncbi:MAG: hypothetical protein ACYC4S_09905 [Rhodoferax sp.]
MQELKENFPELNVEFMTDDIGDGLILLEQNRDGELTRMEIHPIHLLYMAEKMGLVDINGRTDKKTIATLARHLCLLRKRIDHLADCLGSRSSNKHVDLSYVQTYATATADFAAEFCIDLVGMTPPKAP